VILVGKKTDLLKLELQAAWNNNPHGAGFSYVSDGRARIVKGLMKYDDMVGALSACKYRGLISLHLRYATHGRVCVNNTHPFKVGRFEALAHNGVLSAFGESGAAGASDSADLANVLGGLRNPIDRDKILRSIGGMYALTTPRARGGIALFGSNSWQTYRGVRCSNTYWIPRAQPVGGVSAARAGVWGWRFTDDDNANDANGRGGLINV